MGIIIQIMCVGSSVKYRRPNCWTDDDQIWHAYADRSGDGYYLKKVTPHPRRGGRSGILGGQKSGKCHELSRKSIKKIDPLPPGGGSGGGRRRERGPSEVG